MWRRYTPLPPRSYTRFVSYGAFAKGNSTANLRHIAIISPEPKKLYDYYHHLYGMEQVRESPSGSIHVIDGLFNLAFLAQQAVASATVDTHREDGHEIDQSPGIAHFGFTVDRLEDVFDKLDQSVHRAETPQNGRPAEMRVLLKEGPRPMPAFFRKTGRVTFRLWNQEARAEEIASRNTSDGLQANDD